MSLCRGVVRGVLGVFVGFWRGYSHCFFVLPCRTPCSVPGLGSGITQLSEAQGCRFFVLVQFRPADALLSPKPRVPCLRLTWHRAMYGSVCHLLSLCVVFVPPCFFVSTLPPLAGL